MKPPFVRAWDSPCLTATGSPVMEAITDAEQFKPLRNLSKPIAQVMLTNPSVTLHWEPVPGRTMVFHPSLDLLVFPIADLNTIEEEVRKGDMRSDYPPVIFGITREHVLVSSPGHINKGLHTPEAETTIEELKQSLKRAMQIR